MNKNLSIVAAERQVIGAILIDPEILVHVAVKVCPEDFCDLELRNVFRAMLQLGDKGSPVTVPAILDFLGPPNATNEDTEAYLLNLKASVGTTENAGFHANLIREYSKCREVEGLYKEAVEACGPLQLPPHALTTFRNEIVEFAQAEDRLERRREVVARAADAHAIEVAHAARPHRARAEVTEVAHRLFPPSPLPTRLRCLSSAALSACPTTNSGPYR